MAQQILNTGTAANAGDGEGLRSAMTKVNSNFTELYGEKRFGVYNYDNSLTPISIPSNTWTLVTNNILGTNTFTSGGLTGVDIYSGTTNQFDYTGLSLYDTVDYRFDADVTTTTANQIVRVRLVISVGVLNIPLTFISEQFKSSGSNPLFGFLQSHLFTDLVKNNPAQFEVWSDGACTLDVNGWAIKAIKRSM